MTHLTYASYYNNNARDYFSKTSTLDSTPYLLPFLSHLKPDDALIDLGCGSGRDLLLFKKMGFQPTGIEQSLEMARLARDYSGCSVVHGDFRFMDFSHYSVQGIVFSGSLVHLPYESVSAAIANVLPVLDRGGFIYVSLKKGEGTRVDKHERTFYLWEHGDAQMLFESMGLRILDFQETLSALTRKESWLSYTMYYSEASP